MLWGSKKEYNKLVKEIQELKESTSKQLNEVNRKFIDTTSILHKYTDRNLKRNVDLISLCLDYLDNKVDTDIDFLTSELEKRLKVIKDSYDVDYAKVMDSVDSVFIRLHNLIEQLKSIRGLVDPSSDVVFVTVMPEVMDKSAAFIIYPPFKKFNIEATQVAMCHVRTKPYVIDKGELSVRMRLYKITGGVNNLTKCSEDYDIRLVSLNEADSIGKFLQPPMVYYPNGKDTIIRTVISNVSVDSIELAEANMESLNHIIGGNRKHSLLPDIRENGIRNPIIVKSWIGSKSHDPAKLYLYDGHNRLSCARSLGYKDITVEKDICIGSELDHPVYYYGFDISDHM